MAAANSSVRSGDVSLTTSEALDKTIDQLRADNALKAWSVIITFFGDAVVPRGGVVAAVTVQALMQRFGIEPGAVRTALSRLVRDGWVVREKRGRQSYYTLSRQGAQPFEQATRRIYSGGETRSRDSQGEWLLLVNPHADAQWMQSILARVPAVRLNASCVLIDQPALVDFEPVDRAEVLAMRGTIDKVPEWVLNLAGPVGIARGFTTLLERFEMMEAAHGNDTIDVTEAMAARCLLIHEWRRVLLKSADLSPLLLPPDWPRESCRAFVAGLYRSLLPQSEQWLDQQGLAASAETAGKVLQRRFMQ